MEVAGSRQLGSEADHRVSYKWAYFFSFFVHVGGAVLPAFYFGLAHWGSRGFLWWRVNRLGTPLGVLAVHVHFRGGLAGPPREGVGGGWVLADGTVVQERSSHLLNEAYHHGVD